MELPQVYLKQSVMVLEGNFIWKKRSFKIDLSILGPTLKVINGDFPDKTFDNALLNFNVAINKLMASWY